MSHYLTGLKVYIIHRGGLANERSFIIKKTFKWRKTYVYLYTNKDIYLSHYLPGLKVIFRKKNKESHVNATENTISFDTDAMINIFFPSLIEPKSFRY